MNFSNKLKKSSITLLVFICFYPDVNSQEVAVKTNLAYWATTTPNIGMELAVSKKSTLDIGGGLNVFEFSDNVRFKHWLVQPEYRWWFCEAYNGHFLGVHVLTIPYLSEVLHHYQCLRLIRKVNLKLQ